MELGLYRAVDRAALDDLLVDEGGVYHAVSIPRRKSEPMSSHVLRKTRESSCSADARYPICVAKPFFTPIYDLLVEKMVYGRVALIGDAAAVGSTSRRHGYCQAGTDAEVLADSLASHRTCSKVLLVSNASGCRSPEGRGPGAQLGEYMLDHTSPGMGPTTHTGVSSTAYRAFSSTLRRPHFFIQRRSFGTSHEKSGSSGSELARNMRLIGHCDQGGRPDGVQLMVHRGFAYVGHMFSKGFSVVDVRDPARPKGVQYVPAAQNT